MSILVAPFSVKEFLARTPGSQKTTQTVRWAQFVDQHFEGPTEVQLNSW